MNQAQRNPPEGRVSVFADALKSNLQRNSANPRKQRKPAVASNGSLPANYESEKALLCSVLMRPELAAEPTLSPSLFYLPANRIIFDALRELEEHGSEIQHASLDNFLILRNFLVSINALEDAGGVEYLNDIYNAVPTPANWHYYAEILQTGYGKREGILACEKLLNSLRDPGTDLAPSQILVEIGTIRTRLETILPRLQSGLEFAGELEAADIPIPAEIVRGVLHQGSKLAVGGSSKSYKTWLLIDLAISVCHGIDWLGFPTSRGKVLYINLEIQRPFFRRRMLQVCARRKVAVPKTDLALWHLRGANLSIAAIESKLRTMIRPGEFCLIIIDPIYKTYAGKDENATGQISEVVNILERMARDFFAAVAWAAHFSKGNQAEKEAIDRISGSGVWGRDPDSILTFTRHEEADAFVVQMVLRDFPQVEDFVAKFDDGIFGRAQALDPAKLKKPNTGRKPKYSMEKFVGLLGGNELATADYRDLAESELGMPRTTFLEYLDKAETEKRISQSKINNKWEACRKLSKIVGN
jgi:hypothetical protein